MDRACDCEDYLACLLNCILNDEMYSNIKKGLENMNLFQKKGAHRYLQNYKSKSRGGCMLV
eukprot:scaffold68079_cov66-Cyclotella_meneghiniana.AAC.10